MSDTYIPSGEESAQEQQFLQALVGSIQDPKQTSVPKYATEMFANFGGNYLTLAVNSAMLPIFPFPTNSAYSGMCMAMSVFNSLGGAYEYFQLAGLDANGSPQVGTTKSWWGNPAVDFYQNSTLFRVDPNQILLAYLSYYRQSWSVYGNSVYVYIPKWMKTLTMGIRLYDSLGVMSPVLIASKTNAKWQSATVNSGETPDGRMFTSALLTPQQLQAEPIYWDILAKTLRAGTSANQFKLTSEAIFVTGLSERQEAGKSVVTLQVGNYPIQGVFPAQPPYKLAVNNWDSSYISDPAGSDVTWPQGYNWFAYATDPAGSNNANYPNADCTLEVDPVRRWNIPTTLPYVRYFRLIGNNFTVPSTNNSVLSGTYGIYYPSDYPQGRPTLLPMGASTDIFKIEPCNYACVTPTPTGLPTPPAGTPLFNSLDLSTMPIIGVDITAPL